jgi:hypothetical protein
MDLKEEHLLGDAVASHWYYRAKLAALHRAIADVAVTGILDVGAGSGFFSRALLAATSAREAICVDPGYPDDSAESVAGKPLRFVREIGPNPADLVLMMDVIEHVADDRALVRDYVEKAAAGTRFLITVPAFMSLWSPHDVFLEHHRRYTLGETEAVLRDTGLTIEHGHYFYGAVLPMVAAVRAWNRMTAGDRPPESDMRRHGSLTNSLLYGLSAAETAVMRLNRLGGTTAMVRAIKA